MQHNDRVISPKTYTDIHIEKHTNIEYQVHYTFCGTNLSKVEYFLAPMDACNITSTLRHRLDGPSITSINNGVLEKHWYWYGTDITSIAEYLLYDGVRPGSTEWVSTLDILGYKLRSTCSTCSSCSVDIHEDQEVHEVQK